MQMKRILFILTLCFSIALTPSADLKAQCSICTKTASQLGEQPAKALNGAIIYLAIVPLALIGYIGYRWYQQNRS